jgi:hypothetical protein
VLPAADQATASEGDTPVASPGVSRPRRPIRAAAPKPSGPPAWLITALIIGGAAAAFFLLR